MTLGVAPQPSYLKDIPTPGDKIEFEDLSLRFLVDENLENYMEIYTWIRGLGYPETRQEIFDLQSERKRKYQDKGDISRDIKGMDIYSDGSLLVLNSTQNLEFKVNFEGLFPYSLSTIQFDATDTEIEYFTADVIFKYTIFHITDTQDKRLHPR